VGHVSFNFFQLKINKNNIFYKNYKKKHIKNHQFNIFFQKKKTDKKTEARSRV